MLNLTELFLFHVEVETEIQHQWTPRTVTSIWHQDLFQSPGVIRWHSHVLLHYVAQDQGRKTCSRGRKAGDGVDSFQISTEHQFQVPHNSWCQVEKDEKSTGSYLKKLNIQFNKQQGLYIPGTHSKTQYVDIRQRIKMKTIKRNKKIKGKAYQYFTFNLA